jgi:hypothetical protein
VRGFKRFWFYRRGYKFKYAIHVTQHVVVPKAKHKETHGFQNLGPFAIGLYALSMMATIDLQYQLCVSAKEIHDKSINRHLPLEFQS